MWGTVEENECPEGCLWLPWPWQHPGYKCACSVLGLHPQLPEMDFISPDPETSLSETSLVNMLKPELGSQTCVNNVKADVLVCNEDSLLQIVESTHVKGPGLTP